MDWYNSSRTDSLFVGGSVYTILAIEFVGDAGIERARRSIVIVGLEGDVASSRRNASEGVARDTGFRSCADGVGGSAVALSSDAVSASSMGSRRSSIKGMKSHSIDDSS
eukprot:CCRYP_013165-RA/>CCRYP_013165-RA protein AED:0.32 eAED:0.89 QI:35/0/0.33/1/0/0/3/0/108